MQNPTFSLVLSPQRNPKTRSPLLLGFLVSTRQAHFSVSDSLAPLCSTLRVFVPSLWSRFPRPRMAGGRPLPPRDHHGLFPRFRPPFLWFLDFPSWKAGSLVVANDFTKRVAAETRGRTHVECEEMLSSFISLRFLCITSRDSYGKHKAWWVPFQFGFKLRPINAPWKCFNSPSSFLKRAQVRAILSGTRKEIISIAVCCRKYAMPGSGRKF